MGKYEQLKVYITKERDMLQKQLTLHELEMSVGSVNEYKARIYELNRLLEMTKHIDVMKES